MHKQRNYWHFNATKYVFQCRHCNRTSDRFEPYAHQCCACDSQNYRRVIVRICTLRPMEVLHGKFMWDIIIWLNPLPVWCLWQDVEFIRCSPIPMLAMIAASWNHFKPAANGEWSRSSSPKPAANVEWICSSSPKPAANVEWIWNSSQKLAADVEWYCNSSPKPAANV